MKKFLVLLLASATMLSLAACGSDDKEEPETAPETVIEEETASEPEDAGETEEPEVIEEEPETAASEETAEGSVEAAEETSITGMIVSSEEGKVTIQTQEGSELTFTISEETDSSEAQEMKAGDNLEIFYTGELNGEDTSAAVVTRMVETSVDFQ